MESQNNKLEQKESKLHKLINYYYKNLYKNFETKDIIQNRIVDIDIIIKWIEQNWKRPEYKIYIQPKKWLPEITIKNQWVFFLYCVIHGIVPNINSIIISNKWKKVDIASYKNFVLLHRMFDLFFTKWFNFAIYDVISKLISDNDFQEIFENEKIDILTQPEMLSLIKILEDIKITWFDLHKHHFHTKLGKLNNIWTFSENIFLEIAMKYENQIREIIWFDTTYIKPASYEDDSKNKTDFNWVYSQNKNQKTYQKTPIQFTISSATEKLNKVIEYFINSPHNQFIYLQIDGKFKQNIKKIEEQYQNWIMNPGLRESQDPTKFPFFINNLWNEQNEAIIIYFYLHHIIKHKKSKNIRHLENTIDWIDFSNTFIELKEKIVNKWKVNEKIYTINKQWKYIWEIIILEKNIDNK